MFTNIMDTSSVRNIKFRAIEPPPNHHFYCQHFCLVVQNVSGWCISPSLHLSISPLLSAAHWSHCPFTVAITRGVSNEKCCTHSYTHPHKWSCSAHHLYQWEYLHEEKITQKFHVCWGLWKRDSGVRSIRSAVNEPQIAIHMRFGGCGAHNNNML